MSSTYEFDTNRYAGSGIFIKGILGEAVGDRKLVYMGPLGTWLLADADAAATMPSWGLTMMDGTSGQLITILLKGYIGLSTWVWVIGGEIYASTTAGELTQTAPGGAGDVVQIVGAASDTDFMYFNSDLGSGGGAACSLLEGATAYVGFDNCKGAAHANYFLCDGVADDVQIQAAIAYVNGLGGGEIFLETGTYNVTSEILLESDINLGGAGIGNTLIFETAGANLAGVLRANAKDHVSIHDLTLDGNQANNAGATNVLNIVGTDQVWLYNLEILNGKNNCVWIDDCSYVYMSTSYAEGADTNQGFGVKNVHRSTFDNLTAVDCASYGFDFSEVTFSTISNLYSFGSQTTIKIDMGDLDTDICTNLVVNNIVVDGVDSAVGFSGITMDFTENSSLSNLNVINCENGIRVGTDCSALTFVGGYITDVAAVGGNGIFSLGIEIDISDFNIDISSTTHAIVVTGTLNTILGNTLSNAGAGNSLRITVAPNYAFDNRLLAGTAFIAADVATPSFFAPVSDPNTTLGHHPVVDMPDATDTNVYAQILVPTDFQQIITCNAIVVAAASGDMVWTADAHFGKICASEDFNANIDGDGDTDGLTLNDLECIDISGAFNTMAAGDLVGINFMRDGDAGGDTIGDSVYYLGIRLRYV